MLDSYKGSRIYLIAAMVVVLVACSSSLRVGQDCEIIAHRGGSSLAPENSIAAIEKSIDLGVDAVEVDVRMSADGHVVVMHDKRVDRTSNGRGLVKRLSLDELKSLRLLTPAKEISDEKIPTLDEVLACVAGRCKVLIEIKEDDCRGIEQAVADVVARCNAEDWVAVQAFSDDVLERFVEIGVSFPLEKLFVFKLPFLPYIYDKGFSRFSFKKYSYIASFNVKKEFARKGLVKKIQSAGKKVKVWTLKEGESAAPGGVNGVITDYPQLFKP